jgi:hypothetical protein
MLDALTILGGGGWFPAHARHTASALLRDGNSAILIDAGTGVARLIEQPRLLRGVSGRLAPGHPPDPLPPRPRRRRRVPPGARRRRADDRLGARPVALRRADRRGARTRPELSEPFHPVPLDALDIEVRDLPDDEIELSGTRIALRRQVRHSAPTLGLRFDDAFAWVTDTAYDEGSAPFVRGCRMLAHEAWFTSAAPRNRHGRSCRPHRLAKTGPTSPWGNPAVRGCLGSLGCHITQSPQSAVTFGPPAPRWSQLSVMGPIGSRSARHRGPPSMPDPTSQPRSPGESVVRRGPGPPALARS